MARGNYQVTTRMGVPQLHPSDPNFVPAARIFAKSAHQIQLRDGGEPYFEHLEQVFQIISHVTSDPEILAAAYLHDTIEDTTVTQGDLIARFGQRVHDLVMEVTHDGQPDSVGYYFPRLHSQDGILLKFADRLSNLAAMAAWDPQRRAQYCRKSKFWKATPEEGRLTSSSAQARDSAGSR